MGDQQVGALTLIRALGIWGVWGKENDGCFEHWDFTVEKAIGDVWAK